MVAVKAHQAEKFLTAENPKICAVLLFGTDGGLVNERAGRLIAKWALAEAESPEIIRLDDAELSEAPDRLMVELQTEAMFGGQRIVRLVAGQRTPTGDLAGLLASGPPANPLVVEAGNLKPSAKLRQLFEKSDIAAAVACYADTESSLTAMVDDVLRANDLSITQEARHLLLRNLGGDRALSRMEVDKLALYALGAGEVTAEDVSDVVGDASDFTLERIVNAAAEGRLGAGLADIDRMVHAGQSPQALLAALNRHFQMLHRLVKSSESGAILSDVMRQVRPPPHPRLREALTRQLRLWSSPKIERGISLIHQATDQTRRQPGLEAARIERLVLVLSAMVATKRR